MPSNPPLFKTPVTISRTRHAQASVAPAQGYAFAREINALPLACAEFSRAASEYPIVFVETDNLVAPAAILGLRDRENLFVDAKGHWDASYIPAYARSYPFAFSKAGEVLTLCIDETFPGLNTEGRGQRLFNETGAATPYVDRMLAFLREFQAMHDRSQQLSAKLRDLGLLEAMQANVTVTPGDTVSLRGFLTVNRKKLQELPDETLLSLARGDELELIHLHLLSLMHFERLRARIAAAERAAAPAPSEPEPAPPADIEQFAVDAPAVVH